jgi:hypothetical protein
MKFGIVTEEQAAAIKKAWWLKAKAELRVWAVFYAIGFAFLYDPLAACRWPVWVYLAITGASLVLFRRVALWLAFLGAPVLWLIAAAFNCGPLAEAACITFTVAVMAMLVRNPFSRLLLFGAFGSAVESGGRAAKACHREVEAELVPVGYDYATDEHIYPSGRRGPARIRWPYGKPRKTDHSL